MKTGLLGRKLGHSYSPQIHSLLGNYSYELFEKEPEEIGDFLTNGDFDAINVTIPYKQDVIPYCKELSDAARRIGAVNTIVRQPDGSLIGHNTDYFGFLSTLQRSGLSISDKKAVIIGSGGASKPVKAALDDLGANTIVISHKENTPENLAHHKDASVLVNATPVGMYPNNGISPVELDLFPNLEGVFDLIYNPARTKLMMDAAQRGLTVIGGLWMLVAQAKEASEWFTGITISSNVIEPIYRALSSQMENIVLIGMPGSGKSTIGKALAERLGREFADADCEIAKAAGMTIPQIFAQSGESGFRQIETEVLTELSKRSGLVISTGGGCVTQDRNYPLLHQNSRIIWLQREAKRLPTDGRPLSQKTDPAVLLEQRRHLYKAFSDAAVVNDGTVDQCVDKILELLEVI